VSREHVTKTASARRRHSVGGGGGGGVSKMSAAAARRRLRTALYRTTTQSCFSVVISVLSSIIKEKGQGCISEVIQ